MIMKLKELEKALWGKKDDDSSIKWIEINRHNKTFYPHYEIPRVIWIYWDSTTLPEIVKLCVAQVRKLCPEYTVNVLNEKNIKEYIALPAVNDQLPKPNIADLIRLLLLEKYGGVWMDASVFFTENFDWILSRIDNHDAFVFYSDECTKNIKKPISESWFIISPKGSPFISAWLSEFQECITDDDPKNYYSELKNNKYLLQNLTKPDYLLCYISAIVVIDKYKFNILYASAGDTGHYFNYKFHWYGLCVAIELLLRNKSKINIPKLIKFSSSTRGRVEWFINKGIYKKNSLLGCYLYKMKHC